ncbi:50S ribosomal protein [Dirofilaria immitis]
MKKGWNEIVTIIAKMRRITTLILLLLQKVFTFHVISANERFRTSSSNLRSFDSSTTKSEVVQSTASFIINDNGKVGIAQKLHLLQTKVDEILNCCKTKCPGKNDTLKEEFCNGKLTMQTAQLRTKTVKMVLPTRQCISCPCPITPTICPIMPVDHCPCSVQIRHLLPCPIVSNTLQVKSRRRKRQMAEVVVPLDDKPAIEYLRKLGYVEEFNLSPANICHPTNLPTNIFSPNEKTIAVIPIPMQSYQSALPARQQIPIQFLSKQSAFDGINDAQSMNFVLTHQQQEKQQRMVSSGSDEQSKLTNLLVSPSETQLKINDDCQLPGRAKSATAARSRIMFIAVAIIVWIKSSQGFNIQFLFVHT